MIKTETGKKKFGMFSHLKEDIPAPGTPLLINSSKGKPVYHIPIPLVTAHFCLAF